MKQSLKDFIYDWNMMNDSSIIFSSDEAPTTGRPTKVEIRYSAIRYKERLSIDRWYKLNDSVEMRSRDMMYVVTNEYLFRRGIIEIKIASANCNYQERLIVEVLRWFGEKFFQIRADDDDDDDNYY